MVDCVVGINPDGTGLQGIGYLHIGVLAKSHLHRDIQHTSIAVFRFWVCTAAARP